LEPGVFPHQGKSAERERPDSLLERWRRTIIPYLLAYIGAVVLGVIVLAWLLRPSPQPPSSPPIPPKAIVVRSFLAIRIGAQPEKDPTASIYFNAQLSQASDLQVYSQEHFEFEIQEKKLPEIEIARRLGIEKMIYGSVLIEEMRLHIEAHINNVQTGKIEATEVVEGEQKDMLDLLQKLARKIMARLNVAVPKEPLFRLNPSLNVYEQMLKGEGEIEPGAPAEREGTPSPSAPGKAEEKHSWIPLWQEWGGGVAWADEPPPQSRTPEEEVRQALETYRQAYQERNLAMLENVYETFTADQRQANAEYFQNAQDLKVTIRDVDISVSGDKAAVSYTREDEFHDANTGQKVKLDARFTKIFVRTEAGWRMSVGKK
jgi:ketosteroid isomerase-like protein